MENSKYMSVSGIVQNISPIDGQCCEKMISILGSNGITNVILQSDTYVVNNTRLLRGMQISAFYDANQAIPLIFPPQYRATAIAQKFPDEFIVLDSFDDDLVGYNNSLQLNIAPMTKVNTANGQKYTCDLSDKLLMVFYTKTTRSMPPQTTPEKIIVMC